MGVIESAGKDREGRLLVFPATILGHCLEQVFDGSFYLGAGGSLAGHYQRGSGLCGVERSAGSLARVSLVKVRIYGLPPNHRLRSGASVRTPYPAGQPCKPWSTAHLQDKD